MVPEPNGLQFDHPSGIMNHMPNIHETAAEVRRLERLHATTTQKEASLREQLRQARAARDKAIVNDPDKVAARVAEKYGVSDTWVKKLRRREANKTTEGESP